MIFWLTFIALLLTPKPALASGLSIICNDAGCHQDGADWNLSASGITPGWIEYENYSIKNTRKENCLIKMSVAPEGEFLPLGSKVMMSVREEGNLLYAGHLSDLLDNPKAVGMVGAKNANDWVLALSLDQDANESVKGSEAHFGYDVNFTCEPVERVRDPEEGIIINEYLPYPETNGKEWVEIKNINNYPADLNSWKIYDEGNNKTTFSLSLEPGEIKVVENSSQFFNNEGGDSIRLFSNKNKLMDWSTYTKSESTLSYSRQGDGSFCLTDQSKGVDNLSCKEGVTSSGTVLGASVSAPEPINGAPVCTEAKPLGTPQNLTAVAGFNSVTLRWTKGDGPQNYYLVAFGDDNLAQDYGNPNIGGAGTTGYTINGLQSGKTYYFKVRSGNGCAPGEFSNIVSATPTGNVLLNEEVPSGFQGGVLGETTEETGEAAAALSPTPEAESTSGQVMGIKAAIVPNNWMWWVLLVLIILRIVLSLVKTKRKKKSD